MWYTTMWFGYGWPSAYTPLRSLYVVAYVGFYLVLLPLLFVGLLVWNRLIPSVHLSEAAHRRWPLLMTSLLLSYALSHGLQIAHVGLLYFYFLSALASILIATVAAFWGYKPSLHVMALGGTVSFMVGLLMQQPGERLVDLLLVLLLSGWVSSVRLWQNAHSLREVISGFLLGAIPSCLLYALWL